MSWSGFILALIGLCANLVAWRREKQSLDAGADREIAKQTLALLEATEYGKQLRARVNAMEDPEAERLWREMLGETAPDAQR